jgi:hypothetical protein
MRTHVAVATLGLAAGLLAATAGGVAADAPGLSVESRSGSPAPVARAGGAEQLVSATATFGAPGTRVPGMPPSTAPQHQVVMPGGSLSVTVDYGYHWETGALTYHYSLDADMAAPDPSGSTVVLLGFGAFQGNNCVIEEATTARVYTSLTDVLLYDDKDTEDLASAAAWNCSALVVGSGNPPAAPYHDAYVSPLAVTTATPQLSVRTPKRDRLVQKVWTRIPVTVANASPEGLDARDVVVTGAGKGVKVRPTSFGSLDGQKDSDGHVWARLTKPKANLRLVVTEKGQAIARAKVKLRQRPAPAPPRAGKWSAAGVDFTVRGGKVRGFRINTQTTCGGYPDIPTTTTNTYDFPTVRIPRNNEVVGSDGKEGGTASYSVSLDLEFVSRTKVIGSFSYYGPARCVAHDGFTARLTR